MTLLFSVSLSADWNLGNKGLEGTLGLWVFDLVMLEKCAWQWLLLDE